MKKQLLVLFTVSLALAAGCKKDDDKISGKEKLLSKVTEVGDATNVYLADYDSKNRLISYKKQDDSEKQLFTYSGDNLVKIEIIEESAKTVYEISYNGSGQPSTGTEKQYDDDILVSAKDLTYTVVNGKVTKIQSIDEDDNISRYELTYDGDNVTSLKSWEEETPVSVTFTYDNKKSPFYSARLRYILELDNTGLSFFNKNNIVKIKSEFETDASQPAVHLSEGQPIPPFMSEMSISYVYDRDDYPTSGEATNPLGGQKVKKAFEYR